MHRFRAPGAEGDDDLGAASAQLPAVDAEVLLLDSTVQTSSGRWKPAAVGPMRLPASASAGDDGGGSAGSPHASTLATLAAVVTRARTRISADKLTPTRRRI
jgi:hypothetical protein